MMTSRLRRAFVATAAFAASLYAPCASAQQTLEDLTLESMARIVARHPAKNLGVSGGAGH